MHITAQEVLHQVTAVTSEEQLDFLPRLLLAAGRLQAGCRQAEEKVKTGWRQDEDRLQAHPLGCFYTDRWRRSADKSVFFRSFRSQTALQLHLLLFMRSNFALLYWPPF